MNHFGSRNETRSITFVYVIRVHNTNAETMKTVCQHTSE